MFAMHQSTRRQNKKRTLQQPLKITYAIILYIVRNYPNGKFSLSIFVVYLPRPYLPELGHMHFSLIVRFSNHISSFLSDDITTVGYPIKPGI